MQHFVIMKIDTEWFMNRINKKFLSLRHFSEHMVTKNGKPMDVSAVSRTLRGERSMSVYEAKQIAHLLDVSVDEVAKRISGE